MSRLRRNSELATQRDTNIRRKLELRKTRMNAEVSRPLQVGFSRQSVSLPLCLQVLAIVEQHHEKVAREAKLQTARMTAFERAQVESEASLASEKRRRMLLEEKR